MEGRYQTFYQPLKVANNFKDDTFDIDDILNFYQEGGTFNQCSDGKHEQTCCNYPQFSTSCSQQTDQKKNKEILTEMNENHFQMEERSQPNVVNQNKDDNLKLSNPETLNLSRYFYQEILKYLKQLYKSKILTQDQWEIVVDYEKRPKSIKSNRQLFKHTRIKNLCAEYFQSSVFVNRLLLSSKMQFERKLKVLKYTKKFCYLMKHAENEDSEGKNRLETNFWTK